MKRRYLIGGVSVLLVVWLLVWDLWPWKLTLTFLEDGKPVAGLKMEVVIANSKAMNGKTLTTNQDGQISLPRPSTDGIAVVRLWFPDGMRVNTALPIRRMAWTSFDYSSHFHQDGKITTKYPGMTVTQRNAPDPEVNHQAR
ncbi:hypothetical protein Enr10x_26320 [Gimesia panareensis]|uniref:Uncharacterized protein n=1 Tax=Gimesia panareensis TaxID=2527978 RepID=A0A517Q6S2_9PLAN|nr:DUF4198 domain-containing protein [Gimesia panareensis]QDT27315.1 hypothetical protein Enr10x_26320 [Gimesia panareensis]